MRDEVVGILGLIFFGSLFYMLYALVKKKPIKKAAVVALISFIAAVWAVPPEKTNKAREHSTVQTPNRYSKDVEEKAREVEEKKKIKKDYYPFPKLSEIKDKPTETLVSFFDSWKLRDWDRMYNLCQETWKSEHPKNAGGKEFLKNSYGIYQLLGVEILKKSSGPIEGFYNIKTKLYLKDLSGDIKEEDKTFTVVCEIAPYRPVSPDIGKCGVNPLSGMP